jgi:hypothetical protein
LRLQLTIVRREEVFDEPELIMKTDYTKPVPVFYRYVVLTDAAPIAKKR